MTSSDDERQPEQDRAAHHPADAQDHDRERGDRHDHDGVDDPFHDDRPEHGRPADALTLAQGMAPIQLPEPRRQDVVGQIADVGVAEDPPIRQRGDRREEGSPARAARPDIDGRRHQHHDDPGRRRRAQDLERGGDVHGLEQDPDRDDADGDADRAHAAARCD